MAENRAIKIVSFASVLALLSIVVSSQIQGQSQRRRPARSSPKTTVVPSSAKPPAIEFAEPGSPEAIRLAKHRALADKGLVPITRIGGGPALYTPEVAPPRNMGSVIAMNPDLKGKAPDIQKKFADVFFHFDPLPADRSTHFSWLLKRDDALQVGWAGHIEALEPRRQGWLVKIRISPQLYSLTMKTLIYDYVEETYFFDKNGVELITSDAQIPKPEHHKFPVY